MKILHTADIHYSRDNQDPALLSLRAFYEHGKDNGVDLWVIAGDLFDRAVQNTESSGFPELVRVIQNMMNIAPVVAVQGTPTHDIAGCYDALEEINAEYSFTVLDPGEVFFLGNDGEVGIDTADPRLLILGCPEPSKEWFLKDKSLVRDEATQAVKDGMRQLLLGMGAVRKQYADIPCLFVYHGSVEGASMCNGQTLPMGELAIGREDLALVGADYYALGHIHKAQQIPNIPAFYAGSVFPVNWGELEQKGFYEVGIGPADSFMINQVPYPHPPRKKIVRHILSEWPPAEGVEGFQVWVDVQVNKILASDFDRELHLQELLEAGALPGSRVTVTVLPTETVRAGEIREAQGLNNKLAVYAENSGGSPDESEGREGSIAEKAEQLEAEARAEGLAGEGLHIRLDRLVLRGAIGITKGQGKEEIAIDFDRYDPGLVALVGGNGAGKTTLIENCHPFTTMLTRSGKLQDHFCLRDSYRDLYFTDERTGQKYRAFIQIDGQNATGKCEYHLYRDGQPLTDGRKDSYENEITRLFGSLALFQRSAFVAQKNTKNNPDLSEATKGERKALFRELGGLDYLQHYSETARDKAKGIDQSIQHGLGRIETLESIVAGSSVKEDELTELVIQRDKQAENLADLEAESKRVNAELELLRQGVEIQRRIAEQEAAAATRLGELEGELHTLAEKAAEYNEAVRLKADAESQLQKAEALQAEREKLTDERATIQTEREQRLTEHNDRKQAVADEEKLLQAEKAQIDKEIAQKRAEKAVFLSKIDQISEFLEKTVSCPSCGHGFAPGGAEQQQELEKLQARVWEHDKGINAKELAAGEIQKDIEALEWPPEPELPDPGTIDVKLRHISTELQQINVSRLRELLQKAQEAEVRLEELEKRRQQIKAEQARLEQEIEDLQKQLDTGVQLRFDEKQRELTAAQDTYQAARDALRGLEASITALEKQIDELGKKAGEMLQLKAQVAEQQTDAADWRYLEKACGPDGIQALELDAMGPGIAEIANRLLQAAYGSRFQVEFRTTRIGGSGSKTKQIEDFQIWILDSEDGSEQLMETLSGGESVWIKRAIYDAFGIVRDQNTNQRFLTTFMDEMDGALDPESRNRYFQMIQAAHQESGRIHTVIVTHSEQAQEFIPQRIVMSELQAPAREAVA